MLLQELVNKSWYGTIGYISSEEDISLLERYILYNLSILNEFSNIVIATNYKDESTLKAFSSINDSLWKKYFPKCVTITSKINRGHNHGYTDLDNLVFDYCKSNNIKWLCKGANDITLEEKILKYEIPKSDFYYLNGIGKGGMLSYNCDYDLIIEKDFYPQTNFYFIDTSKVDYLNDKDYLDETYKYIKSLPSYNGMIWNYIKGWTCEDFLKQAVQRNNLTTHHLIPETPYRKLLDHVSRANIHDPSHKNILIEGICHLAFPDKPVIKI
jgi:hypothetical protein